jgi:murein DD-endopeptidase MepM/ murein hydrolase activator NlpD
MKRAFGRSAGSLKRSGLNRRYGGRSVKDKSKLRDNLKKLTICIFVVLIILLIKSMNFSYAQKTANGIKSIITSEYNVKDRLSSLKDMLPVMQRSIMRVFNVEESSALLNMPVQGPITSGYGIRTHPVFKVEKKHDGIDIGAPVGEPVKAALSGTVIEVRTDENYGNIVVIDHGSNLKTLYGHLDEIKVSENQQVFRGEEIGLVGNSGISTGSHLHFEVWINDRPVDPANELDTSFNSM